eukprot:m.216441 g.216441  ORF g.216441 m.216441 type:complete len:564 (-) comp17201_c0_seq10:156-1847(-)
MSEPCNCDCRARLAHTEAGLTRAKDTVAQLEAKVKRMTAELAHSQLRLEASLSVPPSPAKKLTQAAEFEDALRAHLLVPDGLSEDAAYELASNQLMVVAAGVVAFVPVPSQNRAFFVGRSDPLDTKSEPVFDVFYPQLLALLEDDWARFWKPNDETVAILCAYLKSRVKNIKDAMVQKQKSSTTVLDWFKALSERYQKPVVVGWLAHRGLVAFLLRRFAGTKAAYKRSEVEIARQAAALADHSLPQLAKVTALIEDNDTMDGDAIVQLLVDSIPESKPKGKPRRGGRARAPSPLTETTASRSTTARDRTRMDTDDDEEDTGPAANVQADLCSKLPPSPTPPSKKPALAADQRQSVVTLADVSTPNQTLEPLALDVALVLLPRLFDLDEPALIKAAQALRTDTVDGTVTITFKRSEEGVMTTDVVTTAVERFKVPRAEATVVYGKIASVTGNALGGWEDELMWLGDLLLVLARGYKPGLTAQELVDVARQRPTNVVKEEVLTLLDEVAEALDLRESTTLQRLQAVCDPVLSEKRLSASKLAALRVDPDSSQEAETGETEEVGDV